MIAAEGEHRATGSLQCSPGVTNQRLPDETIKQNGILEDRDSDAADKGPKDFTERAI